MRNRLSKSLIHLKPMIENVCNCFPVRPRLFAVPALNLTKKQVGSCFVGVELFWSEDEVKAMVFATNQRKLLEHFGEVMINL